MKNRRKSRSMRAGEPMQCNPLKKRAYQAARLVHFCHPPRFVEHSEKCLIIFVKGQSFS